jgi:hypothetical protein
MMDDMDVFQAGNREAFGGIFLFTLAPIKGRRLGEVSRIVAKTTQETPEDIVRRYQQTHGLLANELTREQAEAIVPALGLAGVAVTVADTRRLPALPPVRPVLWIERSDEGCRIRTSLGLHLIRWDSVRFAVFAVIPSGPLVDIVTDHYERFRLSFDPPPARDGDDAESLLTTFRACGLLLTYSPELPRNDGLSSCSIGQEATAPLFEAEDFLEQYEQLFAAETAAQS